jgi:hypothetical protein
MFSIRLARVVTVGAVPDATSASDQLIFRPSA